MINNESKMEFDGCYGKPHEERVLAELVAFLQQKQGTCSNRGHFNIIRYSNEKDRGKYMHKN